MRAMKILLFLIISTILFSAIPLEKKDLKEDCKVLKQQKIKCRWVCDKKLYKEQKIAEAIKFYQNSKYYKFNKEPF